MDPPVAPPPTDSDTDPDVPDVATPVLSDTLPVDDPVAELPVTTDAAPVLPVALEDPVLKDTAPPVPSVLAPAPIDTDPAWLEALEPAARVTEPPVADEAPTATVTEPAS
jgi:hypothetical protein